MHKEKIVTITVAYKNKGIKMIKQTATAALFAVYSIGMLVVFIMCVDLS